MYMSFEFGFSKNNLGLCAVEPPFTQVHETYHFYYSLHFAKYMKRLSQKDDEINLSGERDSDSLK